MKRFVILAVAIALMVPSAALGASSTCPAYNPQNCTTTTSTTSTTNSTSTTSTTTTTEGSSTTTDGIEGTTSTTPTANEGTLPFTGLDVALLAAGGGVLVAAGFIVRRLSTRRQN